MVKKTLLRSLLAAMALMMPLIAGAQNQNCAITVANGTATNQYVPIYGYYCDDYLRCQILFLASDIVAGQFMTDVTQGSYSNNIRSMTFYLDSSAAASWGNASFQVKIKEVPTTTTSLGSSYMDMSGATIVYTGSLSGMKKTMTINFASGFQYNGGNLVVEICNTVKGTYKYCRWSGISYAGASLSGYSSNSVNDSPANSRNFKPKATIIFENTGLATGNGNSILIGDESQTGTSLEYPVNNYYNYSLSETIITASELDGAGTIRSLSLKYYSPNRTTQKGDVSIWIQPTTKTSFSGNNDWVHLNTTTAVKVYQGPLNCNTGWNEFVFMTPYQYNGSGNLVVFIDDNSGDYQGVNYAFYTSPCSGNKTFVVYDDEYNPDPTSTNITISEEGNKLVTSNRALMRINMERTNGAGGIPLATVDFHDGSLYGNFYMGTGYSTSVVTTGPLQHVTPNDPNSYWYRIADTNTSTLTAAANRYQRLANNYFGSVDNFVTYIRGYADASVSSADNGFMMMSLYEPSSSNSGIYNACINLGVVDASSASVVDVSFYQYYRKFYDYCYIDWRTSSNGSWNEMEINVTGEDVDVNSHMIGFVTYTLPLAAAGQDYLEVRLRYFSNGNRGSSSFGYFWIVDDVTISAGPANRLKLYDEEYVYGGYGIIPQNMAMKPAWYRLIKNTGSNAQSNLTVDMHYMNGNHTNNTLLGSCSNGTVQATTEKELLFDPEGWIGDSVDYRGWNSYADRDGANGNCSNLPTSAVGDHYIYASLSSDNLSMMRFDTMHYSVSGMDNSSQTYLWAKDNGVLCYNPYNWYLIGYVQSNNNWYITEDEEEVTQDSGYELSLRYTTGAEIPQGWVIRGMEMVSSPTEDFSGLNTTIEPVLCKNVYDGSSVIFRTMVTGAEEHLITANEINGENIIGRNTYGYRELGDYNTIRIMFPEQPELEPYTSYQVGYRLVESYGFAVAQALDYYRVASPTRPDYDTIIYFKNVPGLKKYSSIFKTNQYDVIFYDPTRDDRGSTFASDYIGGVVPMIRLLVGPPQPVTRASVDVDCIGGELGAVAYNGDEVCGSTITPVEHTSPFVYITRIDQEISIKVYYDDNLVDNSQLDSVSSTTTKFKIHDISGTHRLRVEFSENDGIDNAQLSTLDSHLRIHPNPANSQVNVSIAGAEGRAMCTILDLSGREVWNGSWDASQSNTIDLSGFSKGVYMLRVTLGGNSTVKKLVVK